jgi:FixJ family two-component response regulator
MPLPLSKVLIVDDDASVRSSLARLMRSAGLNAETFASAEDFLKNGDGDSNGPGCLILDVRMDGLSGLELQERLARTRITCPIIFLTGHGNIPMSVQAMKEGAFDFFTKPVDDGVLLDAVSKALERHARILSESATPFRERLEKLTVREFEVMRCVIGGALNKQIAGHLGIAEKTVKVHRGRVMHKLGVESVAELVRHSIEAGVEPEEIA